VGGAGSWTGMADRFESYLLGAKLNQIDKDRIEITQSEKYKKSSFLMHLLQ